MKKIFSLYIIMLLAMMSCESNVENLPLKYLPEFKEKLVITSFISPQDTVIYVKLTASTPLFGQIKGQSDYYVIEPNGDTTYYQKSNVVKDATVTLSSDNQSVRLPYQSKNEVYSIPANAFKIEAGKTYTLRAVTKDKEVEAKTTIPLENIKIDTYTIQPITKIVWNNDTIRGYDVQFKWKDLAQKVNYYKANVEIEYWKSVPVVQNGTVVYENIYENSNISWSDTDYDKIENYFDDLKFDGKEIITPIGKIYKNGGRIITFNGKNYASKDLKSSVLRLQLLNLSKEFYDYHQSIITYYQTGGNPFAEPVPIFNNVKNGLGCFAGYNKSEIVIKNPN
jgi:hypothetical protein